MNFENKPIEGLVAGRNPVIELLKSGKPVDKVFIQKGDNLGGSIGKIRAMAQELGVPVKDASREKLDFMCIGTNHQGVAAICASWEYSTVEAMVALAKEKNQPLFIVLCDDLEDPHNLGAIIRTADAAGAHGIIIPKRNGVGLTASVMKASAGAAQYIPVARVSNLASTIEELKELGAWIYSADMDGTTWCEVDYAGPVVLVIGSEGKGVSRLIKERSDFIVSIPMQGSVNSLNASVASAVVMYEIARQRLNIKAR